MEVLVPFFSCALLAALVAGPILAIVALRRARRLERELRGLRHELRGLKGTLAATREPGAPPAPAAPAPFPVHETEPARVEPHEAPPAPAPPSPARAPASPAPVLTPAAPPADAPRRPRAAVERATARARLDLERWLGVRGAAVVGGIFLALAAIFLFKEAIARDWIPPVARVGAGLAGGIAMLAGASVLRRRGFDWATSALEGAGIVALYASIWAADQRYGLVPPAASFPAMAAVTALACWLALRHGSLFSALLGLAGGFATPVLLAEGEARTLPLFAYLLLLDLGLLFVARRRSWPALGLAALCGTFLFQCMSFFWGREPPATGLALSAAFALLFAASGARTGAARGRWLATQALGVLLPFVFALHYAGAVDLGPHVWPTALLLALLVCAAAVVARVHGAPWLASAAALGSVGVVALWARGLAPHGADANAWELALVALALALVSHALAEWERVRRSSDTGWRAGAALAGLAWSVLALLALATARLESFAPALLLVGGLAALLLRQAHLLARPQLQWAAGLVLGIGLGLLHRRYGEYPVEPDAHAPGLDPRAFWALALGLAAALLAVPERVARELARARTQAAAALALAFASLIGRSAYLEYVETHPWLIPAGAGALGALLLLAAARLRSSAWTLAAVLALLEVGHVGVSSYVQASDTPRDRLPELVTAIVLAPALVVGLVPLVARGLERCRFAWGFLAVLPPASVALIERGWYELHGSESVLSPYLFALVPAALAAALLRLRGAPAHAVGWIAASASFVAAFAIADTLDHSELAVGAALLAAALAVLARRLALRGAGWAAAGSAALATLALVVAASERHAYPRSDALLVNWIAYAHAVPAAAAALVLALAPPRPAAARGLEAWRRPVLGGCVLVTLFLWINLAIENGFAPSGPGARVTLFADGLTGPARHARDLVQSLAWGLYGLVLLVLGTARRVSPLRWASLAVLVLAIGKVFLHDLAHLDGLYRVAALFGLALSLLAVSLLYQRFVFRRTDAAAAD